MLATIHAEDGLIIKEKTEAALGHGMIPRSTHRRGLLRPRLAAIEKVLAWSKRLHICHLSTSAGTGSVSAGEREWERQKKGEL